jgi:hypothetical protein
MRDSVTHMTLTKIGEISNTQHHAHPLVFCDSRATYGGFAEFEMEIVQGYAPITLGDAKACIVAGGDHGHVDAFSKDDGKVLLFVNDDRGEKANPSELAERSFAEIAVLGTVDVTSGTLAIGIAYNALNQPGRAAPDPSEILHVATTVRSFEVRATEGDGGWRIELRAVG